MSTETKTRKTTALGLHLKSLDACAEARTWAKGRTAKSAWEECERPDWLLWWAARDGAEKIDIVRCACACARTALKYVPVGEDRPRLAIEAAEQWIKCPTREAVAYAANAANAAFAAYAANAAAYAAYAAYNTARAAAYAAYAAYNTARAAAYAANAAYNTARAADYAANAAAYAANAAAYAAYAAGYAANAAGYAANAAAAASAAARKEMCDLIRGILKQPWTEAA